MLNLVDSNKKGVLAALLSVRIFSTFGHGNKITVPRYFYFKSKLLYMTRWFVGDVAKFCELCSNKV